MPSNGWYGFDLDGTLAVHEHETFSIWKVGAPIDRMINIVQEYIRQGRQCKIVTARVYTPPNVAPQAYSDREKMIKIIQDWCEEYIGARLEVTCVKDYSMIELWDDRAISVQTNTGYYCRYWAEGTEITSPRDF